MAPWKRETGKRAACLPPVPPGVDPFPVRTWPGLGPTCFSASPRMKAEDPVGTTLWECTLVGGVDGGQFTSSGAFSLWV